MADYMKQFERTPAPKRKENLTPHKIKEMKQQKKKDKWLAEHKSIIEEYRQEQRESGGEYMNMNCYNTLFVGRLAYEVTERKLLREFETFGPVKDIKLVTVNDNGNGNDNHGDMKGKSRGYAFIEFEQEEDMKRAYRAADGMKIEGKEIVVDVERGHTVPTWLPRRLGGGLGGTRLGKKEDNVTRPGRYDPSKPDILPPIPSSMPPLGYGAAAMRETGYGGGRGPPSSSARGDNGGYGGPSPPPMGRGGGGGGGRGYGSSGYHDRGGPPPRGGGGGYGYGPPPDRYYGPPGGPRYGGDRDRDRGGIKRERDRYEDRDGYHSRRRYER